MTENEKQAVSMLGVLVAVVAVFAGPVWVPVWIGEWRSARESEERAAKTAAEILERERRAWEMRQEAFDREGEKLERARLERMSQAEREALMILEMRRAAERARE